MSGEGVAVVMALLVIQWLPLVFAAEIRGWLRRRAEEEDQWAQKHMAPIHTRLNDLMASDGVHEARLDDQAHTIHEVIRELNRLRDARGEERIA